jgi:hypothetical protein
MSIRRSIPLILGAGLLAGTIAEHFSGVPS